MFHCPNCGCDRFVVDAKEIGYTTCIVDGDGSVVDSFDYEIDETNYVGTYRCTECDHEYEDIYGTPPEELWLRKKEKEYVKNGGTNCPVCGESDGVIGHDIEVDSGGANQHCTCDLCGADWYDMYKLDSVQIESLPADIMLEDLFPEGQDSKVDPNKAFKKDKGE